MSDKPILFSGPMVRALLDGRKTQTRRIAKRQDIFLRNGEPWVPTGVHTDFPFKKPYMKGDRLWVKETSIVAPKHWTSTPTNPMGPDRRETAYLVDKNGPLSFEAAADYGLKKTPSIFMPRWASRLTLTVTDVRVQRLHEISKEDAIAEGIEVDQSGHFSVIAWRNYAYGNHPFKSATASFRSLWDSINGKRPGAAWSDNPWIVALTFSVAKQNIDALHKEAA